MATRSVSLAVNSREQARMTPLRLPGKLDMPCTARALVLFVGVRRGSWWRMHNAHLAHVMQQHGFGTLLIDMLSGKEAADGRNCADIGLLASRVGSLLSWVGRRRELSALPTGLMSAGTGVAAAMVAAAMRPGSLLALVSMGGLPDLAAGHLACIEAPTLLMVGGADPEVLAANRAALRLMRCNKRLEVIPGATHQFEEPGAIDCVAEMAAEWFDRHLATPRMA